MTGPRKAGRGRSVVLDAVLVVAALALGAWWTFRDGRSVEIVPLVVVVVVALVFGASTGWYTRSSARRPWLAGVLMAVVIVVFIWLVSVHGAFAGLQWAWLLSAFAGIVVGIDARPRTATAKADSRNR
jgi:hypothetical protein